MEQNKQNKAVAENRNYETPEQYGNESFGIPKDCTKKQKFNGVKLAFYMVVVAAACCLIYTGIRNMTDRYLPEMSFDKSTQPIVYVKGQELVAKPHDEKKGSALASSEALYAEGKGQAVTVADKGRIVFFAENHTSENTFDLYYKSIFDMEATEEDTEEKVLVAEQVDAYKIHPEGKFVLYLKAGKLFFWDFKRARLVSGEVSEFYLSENGQYVVYYGAGSRIYTCPASKDLKPMLVDADIQKVISKKNEYNEIYYIKNNALYLKELGKRRVLIAEQVEDGILLGDFLYYIKKEPYTWRFDELFLDDRKAYDEEISKPVQRSIMSSETNEALGAESYQAEEKRYEEKLLRDSVRAYFEEHPVITERYNLYTVEAGDSVLIDSGLTKNTLSYHSSKSVIVYEKNLRNEKKTRLSTISSIEEALEETERVIQNAEVGMSVLVKDKLPYLGLEEFPEGHIEISLDGKYLYCLEAIGEDQKGVLVRYEIASKALKNRTELNQVVSDFTVDGADSSVAIVFDGNRMGICMDKTYTHLSENSGPAFFYVDQTLYFLDEYNADAEAGQLMRYRNGKIKQIDSNVHSFDVRNLKTVVYIKNYSKEVGFGDLYRKTGNGAREKLDICVRSILH